MTRGWSVKWSYAVIRFCKYSFEKFFSAVLLLFIIRLKIASCGAVKRISTSGLLVHTLLSWSHRLNDPSAIFSFNWFTKICRLHHNPHSFMIIECVVLQTGLINSFCASKIWYCTANAYSKTPVFLWAVSVWNSSKSVYWESFFTTLKSIDLMSLTSNDVHGSVTIFISQGRYLNK